jgi:hypothetical protein
MGIRHDGNVHAASATASYMASPGQRQIRIHGSWLRRRAKVLRRGVAGEEDLEKGVGKLAAVIRRRGSWTTGWSIDLSFQRKKKRSPDGGY